MTLEQWQVVLVAVADKLAVAHLHPKMATQAGEPLPHFLLCVTQTTRLRKSYEPSVI